MLLKPLAEGAAGDRLFIFLQLLDVGGGGGGGVPRICSRIHLPQLTGEVRVGFDVIVRMLACVRMPPRPLPLAKLTRWNADPLTPSMP